MWNQRRRPWADPGPPHASLAAARCGLMLAALALPGRPAPAQTPPARVEVTVTDAVTREPVNGADVAVNGAVLGITDARGVVRGPVRLAPVLRLEARRAGYLPARVEARLERGAAQVAVALQPDPVALPEMRAQATARPRSAQLQEFYDRAHRGTGYYITREQIEQRRPHQLTDLFRSIPAFALVATPLGDRPTTASDAARPGGAGSRGEPCQVRYFVDGTPFEAAHGGLIGLDLRPSDVEGIEVYRSELGVPAKYRRAAGGCGVVLIWKRERI